MRPLLGLLLAATLLSQDKPKASANPDEVDQSDLPQREERIETVREEARR